MTQHASTLDAQIARLTERAHAWLHVDPVTRVRLLRRCIDGVARHAAEWVAAACKARRIAPGSPLSGEEWVTGPMTTVRGLGLLASALERDGQPSPAGSREGPDGQIIAKVFPRNLLDRLLFTRLSAEVWIEPGKPATQGQIYRTPADSRTGSVELVLGAGNVSSIGPLDVAYKLFVEDRVVLLKMNPVNDYLTPFLEQAFAPLIDAGYLQIVTGGADVGAYLCQHPQIDSLHLTGSDRTYDAIVWGGSANKARGKRVNTKPFSAELGCVTPVIVVPGRYSDGDLDFHARNVASMVAHNASFNCVAAKVLITSQDWPQRDAFLAQVAAALRAAPPRYAYYPGAQDRYAVFLDRYPQAQPLGQDGDGVVPWTLIPDVPAAPGEFALSNEAFCGVIADVALPGADATAFLDRAVRFANDDVWGTLSATVIVDVDRDNRDAVERAVADLRYGTISLNAWSGVGFALGVTSWGAYPGHTPKSIGSGVGVVHNTFLFDHPQKSVVRAPFRMWPKPVWFSDHQGLVGLGRGMTHFEAQRKWSTLIGVLRHGVAG